MGFQWTDFLLVGIMLVSGLLALSRGFTREVLSLISWGAAGLAGLLAALTPQAVAFATPYLQPEIVAQVAVGLGVFLVTLIILSLISVKISDWVLDAPTGPFDRTLGFFYGMARGLLLVVIAYFFYDMFVQRDRQDAAVREARLLPVVQSVRDTAVALLPAPIQERIAAMTSVDSTPAAPKMGSEAMPEEGGETAGETPRTAPEAPAVQPAPSDQPAAAPQQGGTSTQPAFGGQSGNGQTGNGQTGN
jgi:membrane protein required for colicin V production